MSNLNGWLNAGLGSSDVQCYGNLKVLGTITNGNGTEPQSFFYRNTPLNQSLSPYTFVASTYGIAGTSFTPYSGLLDNAGGAVPSPISTLNPRVTGTATLYINTGTITVTGGGSATIKFSIYEGNAPPTNDMGVLSDGIPITVTNGQAGLNTIISVPFKGGFSNGSIPEPACVIGYLVTAGNDITVTGVKIAVAFTYASCDGGALT